MFDRLNFKWPLNNCDNDLIDSIVVDSYFSGTSKSNPTTGERADELKVSDWVTTSGEVIFSHKYPYLFMP